MVIDARTVGGVNPMAAPLPVLRVLAGGRDDIAMGIDAKRTAADVAIDTTQLDPSFLSTTTSDRVRMTAFVNMPDGGVMKVIRAVRLGHSQGHGLSWRVFDARRELRLTTLDSPVFSPQS
jgi:hypothetical protein